MSEIRRLSRRLRGTETQRTPLVWRAMKVAFVLAVDVIHHYDSEWSDRST
jgi:hypothetical protein